MDTGTMTEQSKRPILILVGGGRGNWPNFWSVMAYQPKLVYLISPSRDDANTLFAQEFFSRQGIACGEPAPPPINAFDLEGTRRACAEIVQRHAADPVLINVTSSPKMMGFGACYAVLDAVGRKDVCVFHRDTANSETHAVAGTLPPPGPYLPTIENYLAAYGRQARENFDFDRLPCTTDELMGLVRLFGSNLPAFTRLMKYVRYQKAKQGSGEHGLDPLLCRRGDFSLRLILKTLVQLGFLTDLVLDEANNKARFQVSNGKQIWPFLDGKWMEMYAYDQACTFRDNHKQPIFHECKFNLQIPSHEVGVENGVGVENEIDLACLTPNGLLLYASCKSGSSKDPSRMVLHESKLSDIVDRANLLGGSYCGKMLITMASGRGSSEAQQASIDSFKRQAAARQIQVVFAEDFPNLHACFDRALEEMRRSR